ncbi:transcription factor A, mitochondrial-like [Mizuhopecten yessoensis]|uniref:transcription factor A, mitochondrial-like n=1 Tax=Mizuhopecten yessoensis TaxID=6573 RepID=UPI000B457244|nr:transcription factor A, mitochondrial-like [Mizuhopecten yessoensis]
MALHAFSRCSGIFRSVVSGTIRAPVCKAWYGTIEDNGPKKGQLPPPRPGSSFMLFYMDSIPEIKLKNPGQTKIGVWSKQAGEMWRNLPNEERQIYAEKSKLAWDSYHDQIKKYTEGLTPDQLQEMQEEKWKLQEGKKIRKAYEVALSKHRMPRKPKIPLWTYGETVKREDENFVEMGAKVRAGWKQLPDLEKEVFITDYESKMEQWKEDYGIWVQEMLADGYSEFITPSELKQELRRLGKPKRPLTSYMLYQRACQMERGNMSFTAFAKEMGSRWQQMTDKEKEVFFAEAKIEKDNYIKDMSQWREGLTAQQVKFTEMAEKIINGTLEKELKLAEKNKAKQTEIEKRAKERLAKQKEKQKLGIQKAKQRLAKQKEKIKLAKQSEKQKLGIQKEKEE